MGDTGSLMLGGVISGIALYLKNAINIISYSIYTSSRNIICYNTGSIFQKTGNRIFKMTPIHHHFELSGWRENKIVIVFSLITLVMCFIGLKII